MNPQPSFEVINKDGDTIKMRYDDVDYLIESVRLSFPNLCPTEEVSEADKKNPLWMRQMSLEVTKMIPALCTAFADEYGTTFNKGAINTLFNKFYEYKASLKKNMVGEQSSAPSTDSTAPA